MPRLMIMIPQNMYRGIRAIGREAKYCDVVTDLAASALLAIKHRVSPTERPNDYRRAVAFLLQLAGTLHVMSRGEAYSPDYEGAWRPAGGANTNRESGKCGPARPRRPKRTRPRLVTDNTGIAN